MSSTHKLFKIIKIFLSIWGGFSLIGLLLILSFFAYSFTYGNQNLEDKVSKSDVRFVLNWCGLGDERIESVEKSYTSARSFTGDHLDAYSIKIAHITIDELTNTQDHHQWYRADSLPTVLDKAVSFVGGWQHQIAWFPNEEMIRTKDFYVYPWNISFHGISPNATQLIFAHPKEKMVYYISTKM